MKRITQKGISEKCIFVWLFMLSISLVSCGGGGGGAENIPQGGYYISPLGITSHIPDSIFANHLWTRSYIQIQKQDILNTVLYWTDYRVSECVLKHPDVPNAIDIARKINFYLYDDYAFKCGSISPTGLCAGATDMSSYIEAPVYGRWSGDILPDFQTAPHLIRTKFDMAAWSGVQEWINQGKNYYASDVVDYGLPAVCHELEHVLYGEKYGHLLGVTKHITVFEW